MTAHGAQVDCAALIYIDRCLEVLRLQHWDAILGENPSGDGTHAEMTTGDGRYIVIISLSENWCDKTLAQMKNTLFHECLHVVHSRQEDALKGGILAAGIGSALYSVIWQAYGNESEFMVDRLSRVMEPLWPKWPTKSEIADAVRDARHETNGEY